MSNKYDWLTKEILEQDYNELGSFKLIAEKYKIPRSTIERYCKLFSVKTTPKIRYDIDHEIFSQDTEKSFYLAGFIAADGCVSQHKCDEPNHLSIVLSEKDEKHLRLIKNLLQFNGPLKMSTKKLSLVNKNWNDCKQIRMDIYSRKIIKDLERFGIGQRKSLVYNLPNWLLDHPYLNHFVRGYIDGDGSFYVTSENRETKKFGVRKYNKLSFSLRGAEEFLLNIKKILERHNIFTVSNPKFNNGIFQLRYLGNIQVGKIARFLYDDATVFLERKYNLVKDLI